MALFEQLATGAVSAAASASNKALDNMLQEINMVIENGYYAPDHIAIKYLPEAKEMMMNGYTDKNGNKLTGWTAWHQYRDDMFKNKNPLELLAMPVDTIRRGLGNKGFQWWEQLNASAKATETELEKEIKGMNIRQLQAEMQKGITNRIDQYNQRLGKEASSADSAAVGIVGRLQSDQYKTSLSMAPQAVKEIDQLIRAAMSNPDLMLQIDAFLNESDQKTYRNAVVSTLVDLGYDKALGENINKLDTDDMLKLVGTRYPNAYKDFVQKSAHAYNVLTNLKTAGTEMKGISDINRPLVHQVAGLFTRKPFFDDEWNKQFKQDLAAATGGRKLLHSEVKALANRVGTGYKYDLFDTLGGLKDWAGEKMVEGAEAVAETTAAAQGASKKFTYGKKEYTLKGPAYAELYDYGQQNGWGTDPTKYSEKQLKTFIGSTGQTTGVTNWTFQVRDINADEEKRKKALAKNKAASEQIFGKKKKPTSGVFGALEEVEEAGKDIKKSVIGKEAFLTEEE